MLIVWLEFETNASDRRSSPSRLLCVLYVASCIPCRIPLSGVGWLISGDLVAQGSIRRVDRLSRADICPARRGFRHGVNFPHWYARVCGLLGQSSQKDRCQHLPVDPVSTTHATLLFGSDLMPARRYSRHGHRVCTAEMFLRPGLEVLNGSRLTHCSSYLEDGREEHQRAAAAVIPCRHTKMACWQSRRLLSGKIWSVLSRRSQSMGIPLKCGRVMGGSGYFGLSIPGMTPLGTGLVECVAWPPAHAASCMWYRSFCPTYPIQLEPKQIHPATNLILFPGTTYCRALSSCSSGSSCTLTRPVTM